MDWFLARAGQGEERRKGGAARGLRIAGCETAGRTKSSERGLSTVLCI